MCKESFTFICLKLITNWRQETSDFGMQVAAVGGRAMLFGAWGE
jgi:hypothetical protein